MKDEGKNWRILAPRVDCRKATVNAGVSLRDFLSPRLKGVKK